MHFLHIRPSALARNAMDFEPGDDDLLDRVEEERPRVLAAAKAVGDALRRRGRAEGKMRELVLDEMGERDLEVVAETHLRVGVELRRESLERAPPESRV